MKSLAFNILLSTLAIICFSFDNIAQVTSVNGETGEVQVNLSLNGNSLSITGSNAVNLPYGNGDISSVTAGTGLSGGGATGTITINANNTSAIWNANKLLGGNISSTAPALNQVLKYNGTEWAPDEDLTETGGGSLWLENSSDIYFNSGNLSIGTTNSDALLTVKGKIHAEELIIDLNVPAPDYVFGEEYDLMPLDELERYIFQNKHLPGVPPAKELEAKTINLSEMNMLVLKKVEELTLYVIEHEKRINKFQK